MVDRVRPLKWESIATGGSQDDTDPTEVNRNEDFVDCRGIAVQSNSSNDEAVQFTRDVSDNAVIVDPVSGTKTLAQLIDTLWYDGTTYLKPITDGRKVRAYGSSGTNYIDFYHDNTNAHIIPNSGTLIIGEGTLIDPAEFLKSNTVLYLVDQTNIFHTLSLCDANEGVIYADDGLLGYSFRACDDTYVANMQGGDSHLGDDDEKSYFGTADDASIYYDGTDLVINPQEVGAGDLWIMSSIKGTDGDFEANNSSLCFGYKAGGTKTVQASGYGSVVLGAATGSGGVTFEATSYGSLALGRCSGYDAHGKLRSTGSGSLACGHVGTEGTDALLESSGYGSVALGRSETNWTAPFPPNAANLKSQNHGSFAGGYAQGYSGGSTANLVASGVASFAFGHAYGGTLQATGTASVAMGKNVQVTGNYSHIFGRDFTNSQADRFSLGWGQEDFTVETQGFKPKLYSQTSEPTFDEDGFCAFWKDTDDSNRVWLVFRRGSGDHVKVELT